MGSRHRQKYGERQQEQSNVNWFIDAVQKTLNELGMMQPKYKELSFLSGDCSSCVPFRPFVVSLGRL